MARYPLIKLDDPDETKVRNNSANKLRHRCVRDESKIKRNSSSSLFGTYDGCDLSFPVTVAFLSARKPEKTIIERETAPVSLFPAFPDYTHWMLFLEQVGVRG